MMAELTFDREQIKALEGRQVQLRNGEQHVITGLREEHDDCFEMRGSVHDASCIARKRMSDVDNPYDIVKVLDR